MIGSSTIVLLFSSLAISFFPKYLLDFQFNFTQVRSQIVLQGTQPFYPLEHTAEIFHILTSLNDSVTDYIKFFNYSNDLSQVMGYSPQIQDELNRGYNYLDAKIIHLRSVYISVCGSIVDPKNLKYTDLEFECSGKGIWPHPNGDVLGSLYSVIGLGHDHIYIYSHWFYDVLAPLCMFPSEIIDKSIVLTLNTKPWAFQSLEALGVKPENVLGISPGQWYFAENAYVCFQPCTHISHYGSAMKTLSKKLRAYLKLDSIKPSQFTLSNRPSGSRRHITNWNEVVKAIREAFPSEKFEDEVELQDFSNSALIWAKSKLMFMPTGSNFIRNLYMKERSVLVIGLANILDNCISLTAAAHKCHSIYFVMKGMDHHHNYNGGPCPLPPLLKAMKAAIYCVEHGHWDPQETFEYHEK